MRAVPVEHKIGRIAEGGRGDALPGRSNLLVAPAKPGDGCLDEVQKVRLLAARGLRGEGGDQLTRGALCPDRHFFWPTAFSRTSMRLS